MKNRNPRKGWNINILLVFIGIVFFSFISITCPAQNQAVVAGYPVLIQQADQALAKKDYPAALLFYEKASHSKPELRYAAGKIEEINKVLDAAPDLRSQLFENRILAAEGSYKQKDYAQARTYYLEALTIDPAAQFPKDRLAQISAVFTDPSDLTYFNDAVSNGDRAMTEADYDKAILFYQTALAVKPGAKTVKDKITAATKQQQESKARDEQSAKIVAAADKLLQAEKRPEARAEYQKALVLTPGNSYAKQKIQEIDKFVGDKQALQASYEKLVEQADQFYINRDFANARIKYQEALTAKPAARYPKEMLEKTKSGESQLLSDQQRYDAALASAENLYKTSDYEAALIGFKSASALKPSETYPVTKIAEIEKLVGERTSRKEAYDIAIKNGDQEMGEKKYEAALSYYRNSLTLLSAEKYPLQKIEEINLIISELKALDENYKSAVATADKLFGLKNFEEAISTYTKALGYKPTEAYPQQKITEAQNQLATVKNRDENYVAAIANGDRLFLESKLNEALDAYRQALALKPAEKYPREKSDEINKILLRQKTESDQYALALASGDKALGAGNFSLALKSYQEALVIKPNEKELLGKIDDVKLALAAKQNADEQYLTTLNTGDKLFAGKEYERAIIAYTDAVNSKPAEKYPQDQIVKINKIIGDLRSADDSYARAVSEGDLQFDNQKYTEAIASYKKASSFKPSETYPKTQLDKLNVLIAEQKKTESDYTALLASADKFLAVKKFDEAIADYRKALAIKPSEKYPADKVAETEKLLADLKSQQEAYDKAVADADKYLLDKDFVKALASYKEAGATKPSEAYPKQKITEVQAILDKDKAEGQRYQEAIAQADKFFADKKYLEALEPYQRALGIRPAEKYPQDQIASINKKIDELKKLDEDYLKLIAEANTELKAGKYEEARGLFTNAATLKPAEKLPMDKIVEIDGILSDLKNKEESFAKHISEGDAFFAGNQYNEAIASYNSALKIKPGETYPQSRIDKINVVLAGQKKLDSDYLATVTSADQFLSAKQYDEAIADYRKALTLKPSETYPSEKIAETEKLLADLKALQEAYDKAVANADKFLLDKDFAKALTSYKEANVTRPDEAYPKQKITEVQAILDKDKAEAQLYQEAIAQADKLFADHKYQEAKDPYLRASGIKPGEKYPQDQIAGINKLLDEQKKLDDDYQSAITEAEIQLKGGKYDNALKLFVTATTLKPTEKLPKDKIAEIDGILAEIQNKEQSYSKAVSEADASFAAKNFTEALASYSKASKIKPAETYPPAQMEKINTLLAAQKKLDDDYLTQLASADQLFDSQKYTEAIAGYRKALAVKPSEKYPSEKIAEAEKQIADQKALQQTYDKAVAEGTKKLSEKDYANALKAFQTANTAKPSETLPPQKIGEIQAIQDKIKAENERYLEAIALADKFYASEKYREAIEPYQSATTIKPTEKYPQDQVVKINQLLAEQKKTDDDYQKLITDADTRMTTGKYEEARGLYTTAGTLKPLEKLPKDKIAEIETILAGLKLKDENYTKALDRAAGLYADKNLKGALNAFEEALTIKPAEKYPQEQIATIKAAIKAIDDSYNKAIALGDEKLASKNLMDALNAYQNASEIKPGEEYPKTKIAGINSALIAQKEEMAKMYASYLAEGDRLSAAKDYASAKSAFTKATGIKPEETYPKQRLAEINKIVEEAELAHRAEYNKALGEADKLYNSKIFDQAIDAYEAAALISPDEAYPALQISKIRKYMADHSIQDLFSQTAVISEGNEKKFTFSSIEPRLRKNNYILLKARSTGKTAPKVYLNYGKDNQKNGGIVLRSLDKTTIGDYIIRISVQDKWYREDNNWISLFVETGDIEITKVQIAAGDD